MRPVKVGVRHQRPSDEERRMRYTLFLNLYDTFNRTAIGPLESQYLEIYNRAADLLDKQRYHR